MRLVPLSQQHASNVSQMSALYRKNVLQLVKTGLVSLGFRKRKHVFSLSVSEDVLGLIGLNTASRGPGVMEINTVIAVSNRRVGQLLAELEGKEFDETSPFLAHANVGYLSPASKYHPFLFPEPEPPEEGARQLVAAVEDYGLPFIHSNQPLAALLHTMRSTRFASSINTVYGIPVALHLLGEDSEADAFLREQLDKLGPQEAPFAQRYRNFAIGLRARMGRSS